MFLNAKSGTVKIENTDMDYISYGKGKNILIMIPGVADGMKTVKGMALPLAMQYKKYAKDYTVYVFSRKNGLEKGYSTRDMARDQAEAMKALGIEKAHIMGISQGGMIAQYFAIDYPDMVDKLVLAVTLSKQNETVQAVIGNWIKLAEKGKYEEIMLDTAEKCYTESYRKKYLRMYPIAIKIGKPKDLKRFIIQAESCINHNSYDELHRIQCSVLVIGGDSDKIVGPNSSKETADRLKGADLILYKGLGHGTFEEAKDFNDKVLDWLLYGTKVAKSIV